MTLQRGNLTRRRSGHNGLKGPVFQAVPGYPGSIWVHANVKARWRTGERTGGYLSKNRHNVCKRVSERRRHVPEGTVSENVVLSEKHGA
jgi:hypothetical protein